MVCNIGVQWVSWIFAIIDLCEFLVYIATRDETIYKPEKEPKETGFWGKTISRKINSLAFKPKDIVAPFSLACYLRIVRATCAHAITFFMAMSL
jgi:hypothetical protein